MIRAVTRSLIEAAEPSSPWPTLLSSPLLHTAACSVVMGAAAAGSGPPPSHHGGGRCRCCRDGIHYTQNLRASGASGASGAAGLAKTGTGTGTSRRHFRSTRRNEIVPLIGAAAVVAVVGRYSYRALQRMEGEWDDYQWELRRYEKMLARDGGDPRGAVTVAAVDAGTLFTKIALNREVAVSREGDRAVFSGVTYEYGDSSGAFRAALRGRQALERYFYEREGEYGGDQCEVMLPWTELMTRRGSAIDRVGRPTPSPADVLYDSVSHALHEALERINDGSAVRVVVAAPSGGGATTDLRDGNAYDQTLGRLVETASSDVTIKISRPAVILPDCVAATWGAQLHGLLPDEDNETRPNAGSATLVVDVGALASEVSVVRRDVVLSSTVIPWGGENWVRSAVDLLLRDSSMPAVRDARSLTALQLHARSSVAELSSKARVSVHVPYLFPDPRNHHLDAALSRTVLEQAVVDDIRRGGAWFNTPACFSPHLPPPTDLASMWMSCITLVLEQGKLLPSDVDHVLLVGGGSKPPSVPQSLKSALFGLLGSDAAVASKIVVPEPALQGELTAIGASTMLPSFEYIPEHGLQRITAF